jgi:hypothetical protein
VSEDARTLPSWIELKMPCAVMSLGKALFMLIVFIWLRPKVSGGVPRWGNMPFPKADPAGKMARGWGAQ